ncbi:HNH endonuclease family protein [Sphaerisporangium aureirubrum]|uniref:HNH endonuclease family protein n=1 Tax=Sphaerisporangium aureirubrum TaxID=1544736 RepID=A0ABW1ND12_9ACTN
MVFAGAAVLVSIAAHGTRSEPPRHPTQSLRQAMPLDNPDGTKRGLSPITSRGDRAAARKLIRKLRVGTSGSLTGYTRTKFGAKWADDARGIPYARNGCRTRDDLLARDGQKVRFRRGSDCVVVALRLTDPYTGRTITWRREDADRVQVDHVVPLAYEWRMGARNWPMAKRMRIANDPLNLLPVSRSVNVAKGGSGPASWLPPSHRVRCAYAARFAQVAVKYALPVTAADKRVMLRQCR